MISINDRLMLECPENYNDMADQLDNEDNNEVGGNSHVNTFSQEVVPVNGNGTSNDLVIVEKDKVNAHNDDDEDLEHCFHCSALWSLVPANLNRFVASFECEKLLGFDPYCSLQVIRAHCACTLYHNEAHAKTCMSICSVPS